MSVITNEEPNEVRRCSEVIANCGRRRDGLKLSVSEVHSASDHTERTIRKAYVIVSRTLRVLPLPCLLLAKLTAHVVLHLLMIICLLLSCARDLYARARKIV